MLTNIVEYRKAIGRPAPGRVLVTNSNGDISESTERLQPFVGVVSDTYGLEFNKSNDEQLAPIAMAGRVLAFPFENREGFRIGDPVCTAPGGTISLMTREEVKIWPDRMVGVVTEIPSGLTCGTTNEVYINGRIWIRVN